MTPPATVCKDCGGLVEGTEDHWLTCTSPSAKQRRIRRFLEPGWFPISYSAAKVYEECERRWHWQYVLGGLDESGDPARLGTVAHEFLAARIAGSPIPRPDIPLELTKDWGEMRGELEVLADQIAADPDLLGVEVEMLATLPLHNGDTAQAKGLLDVVFIRPDGMAKVIDYKSGFKLPTEEDLRRAGSQGLWNAWLIMRNFEQVYAVEFEIRPLREHARPVTVIYDWNDVAEFGLALEAQLATMIEDKTFKPRPGEVRCRQCPLLLSCDAGTALVPVGLVPLTPEQAVEMSAVTPMLGQEAAEVAYEWALRSARAAQDALMAVGGRITLPAIRTPEEAVAFANRLVVAEAVTDAGRRLMNDFTAWYGPVRVGEGKAYAHWDEMWKEISVIDFFQIMRAAGIGDKEIIACLKVDMKAADKFIWGRTRPALPRVRGLREALSVTKHTKFGLKKVKEDSE